ncbi:MAG: membrane lipoprotein lipid attachment site-containing protein [Methylophaga sp.]|nr:membrane lipoprotein lipid attachment site-containing protein [Methylophaga sp.]
MMKKIISIVFATFILSACYEDTRVTLHEPGVYKGKRDTQTMPAEEREALLKLRFNEVQTDR